MEDIKKYIKLFNLHNIYDKHDYELNDDGNWQCTSCKYIPSTPFINFIDSKDLTYYHPIPRKEVKFYVKFFSQFQTRDKLCIEYPYPEELIEAFNELTKEEQQIFYKNAKDDIKKELKNKANFKK